MGGPAGEVLRGRKGFLARQAIRFELTRRQHGDRSGLFDRNRHFDHAMLQGLEPAKVHAKLLARFQIFQRRIAADFHCTQRFGAKG